MKLTSNIWILIFSMSASCGSHPKDKHTLNPELGEQPKKDDGNSNEGDSTDQTKSSDGSSKNKPTDKKDKKQNNHRGSELVGAWKSSCAKDDEGKYKELLLDVAKEQITSEVKIYETAGCASGLVISLKFVSDWTGGSASSLGQGVKLIDYVLKDAFMTLHTNAEVFQANESNSSRGRCLVKWQKDVRQKISALPKKNREKCGGSSAAPAPGSKLFDIYQIKGTQLRFGLAIDKKREEGVGESSSKRPNELVKDVFTKQR